MQGINQTVYILNILLISTNAAYRLQSVIKDSIILHLGYTFTYTHYTFYFNFHTDEQQVVCGQLK